MKSAAFRYARPENLAEAMILKRAEGEDARWLAGGQSLVPMMNLRMASPSLVIDLSRIRALTGISLQGETLRIGAMTRHAAVGADPMVARHAPLLAQAAPWIAHPAIRARGTIGGSLALADPAAEWPACCLALDATLVALGMDGAERHIAAADFFQGIYATALLPDELLLRVEIPVQRGRSALRELARRHGDYATVGLAATSAPALAFFGVADRPLRFAGVEAALADQGVDAAVALLRTTLEPIADLCHAAATKSHLAGVLLRRVAQEIGA